MSYSQAHVLQAIAASEARIRAALSYSYPSEESRKRKRDEYEEECDERPWKRRRIMEQDKRMKIDEDDAEVIRDGAINILRHKRIPKVNKHKDSAYVEAAEKHKKACGKNGGFVKGSGYHYDKEYKA